MGAGEDLTVCVTPWDTAPQKIFPMALPMVFPMVLPMVLPTVTAPVAASGVLDVSTRSVRKGWRF